VSGGEGGPWPCVAGAFDGRCELAPRRRRLAGGHTGTTAERGGRHEGSRAGRLRPGFARGSPLDDRDESAVRTAKRGERVCEPTVPG